jgi:hypothetical protein
MHDDDAVALLGARSSKGGEMDSGNGLILRPRGEELECIWSGGHWTLGWAGGRRGEASSCWGFCFLLVGDLVFLSVESKDMLTWLILCLL